MTILILRRDLTINSVFYNIQTENVEDYTGQGLADIENKLVRTPLEPLVTFLDDPLRVMRAIRFTARFNFKVAPELMSSTMNPAVLDSFKNKVSRQRILAEIEGTLSGSDIQSIHGLYLLHRSDLMRLVIVIPPLLPREKVVAYTQSDDPANSVSMFSNLDLCAVMPILGGFMKLLVSNNMTPPDKLAGANIPTVPFPSSTKPTILLASR